MGWVSYLLFFSTASPLRSSVPHLRRSPSDTAPSGLLQTDSTIILTRGGEGGEGAATIRYPQAIGRREPHFPSLPLCSIPRSNLLSSCSPSADRSPTSLSCYPAFPILADSFCSALPNPSPSTNRIWACILIRTYDLPFINSLDGHPILQIKLGICIWFRHPSVRSSFSVC